jgi:PKD repeat protein
MKTAAARASFLATFASICFLSAPLCGETFTDSFERPDGPIDGWTVPPNLGPWNISGGKLLGVATGGDRWVWAGTPPFAMRGDFRARAKVEFPTVPPGSVGRHGGLMFLASVATHRGDPMMNGYTIDWIDRPADHGLRLLRWDNGVQVNLAVGTPHENPPLVWEIEVEGDAIRIFADDDIVFEVFDGTHRDGHFGAWAFQNTTRMTLDDVEVEYSPVTVKACFTSSATRGRAPFSVDFDASCTTAAGNLQSFDWDFGDGSTASGQMVNHVFQFGGSYVVTLTASDDQGNSHSTAATIDVFEVVGAFSDDFSRPDGPVDGWTVFRGEWSLIDERLTTITGGAENWCWAGDPAHLFPPEFDLSFRFEFLERPLDVVGRHGGVMFCASAPTHRYDNTLSGYTIDWIDRLTAPPFDRGYRFIRWTNSSATPPLVWAAEDEDPGELWNIVIEGDVIRLIVDGEPKGEVIDSNYRGGFIGFWGWSNGQMIAIDDVVLTTPELSACFTVSPGRVAEAGSTLTFDAGCSIAQGPAITAYEWDFGDGSTGSGATVMHSYAFDGIYQVTLKVTAGASTAETQSSVEIFVFADSFQDDFDRQDGPPDGWTIATGNWNIVGGELAISTPIAPESWIWAGAPALRFGGIEAMEFELRFPSRPGDGIGRHGGVFFFAQNTALRFGGNSGYSLDWIDRPADRGYRFIVWTNGVATPAVVLAPEDEDPGELWRIEVDGDLIRLIVDGELKGEVEHTAYRTGHFGFWSYFNAQEITFDNVNIGVKGPGPVAPRFVRGDADSDGTINLTDAVRVLNFLFTGGQPPACADAADADDSGTLSITDAIRILGWLFSGGPVPLPPSPSTANYVAADCGIDTTADLLDCAITAVKCR